MSNIIWNEKDLSEALSINIDHTIEITGITINSKEAKPGDLFIGLEGTKHNGSKFAKDAIERGATLCIVDHIPNDCSNIGSKHFLLVLNTYEALLKMAKYARERFKGKIIGITGSVGKTTTKEMVKLALSDQKVFATRGNYNSYQGLPISLCSIPKDCEIAILEIGINSAKEMEVSSSYAMPHISVINNVYSAHLEAFGEIRSIAEAKSIIYNHTLECAIMNADSPYVDIMRKKAIESKLRIISFGQSSASDIRLISCNIELGDIRNQEENRTTVNVSYGSRQLQYYLGSIGEHIAINSLAVLAILYVMEIDIPTAVKKLQHFKEVQGRGNVHNLQNNTLLIDDTYNANPASVKSGLAKLAYYKRFQGRLIAILGDMKELGETSKELHLNILDDIMKHEVDLVFTVGEIMQHLFDALPDNLKGAAVKKSEHLVEEIISHLQPNDVILVKGSRAVDMAAISNHIISSLTEGLEDNK